MTALLTWWLKVAVFLCQPPAPVDDLLWPFYHWSNAQINKRSAGEILMQAEAKNPKQQRNQFNTTTCLASSLHRKVLDFNPVKYHSSSFYSSNTSAWNERWWGSEEELSFSVSSGTFQSLDLFRCCKSSWCHWDHCEVKGSTTSFHQSSLDDTDRSAFQPQTEPFW